LFGKVALADGTGHFDEPVGKRGFAVVDVRYDAKITDIFHSENNNNIILKDCQKNRWYYFGRYAIIKKIRIYYILVLNHPVGFAAASRPSAEGNNKSFSGDGYEYL